MEQPYLFPQPVQLQQQQQQPLQYVCPKSACVLTGKQKDWSTSLLYLLAIILLIAIIFSFIEKSHQRKLQKSWAYY